MSSVRIRLAQVFRRRGRAASRGTCSARPLVLPDHLRVAAVARELVEGRGRLARQDHEQIARGDRLRRQLDGDELDAERLESSRTCLSSALARSPSRRTRPSTRGRRPAPAARRSFVTGRILVVRSPDRARTIAASLPCGRSARACPSSTRAIAPSRHATEGRAEAGRPQRVHGETIEPSVSDPIENATQPGRGRRGRTCRRTARAFLGSRLRVRPPNQRSP
jgi:hypothetical protein